MLFNLKQITVNLGRQFIHERIRSEEDKIIYIYRYVSWFLTSVVYLTGKPYALIIFKLGVTLSLFISSKIITDIYVKYSTNKKFVRTLVFIETLGITLLLLPTKGLESPFLWYALNPTLVAACYLPAYFCWINLLFYLVAGTFMSYYLFNLESSSIITMFVDNANQVLVLVLITLAVQLLSDLTKKLATQTNILKHLNDQKEDSMNHIMSLYQIIETLNNHNSKNKLFETLAEYTAKLTKSEICLFWLPNISKEKDVICTNRQVNKREIDHIIAEFKNCSSFERINKVREISIHERGFFITPILSTVYPIGFIAIQINQDGEEKEQHIKLLEFISGLCSVTLERFYMEDIEDNLLVIDEQNRIANEIHDSVSQRLFSISYAFHGILGKWNSISKKELKEYIEEMNESANSAMKELRNVIYQLSSRKKGEISLQVTLEEFFNSLRKLQQIRIDFEVKGDESLLSLSLKQAITRIIREACSNATKHGKCQMIALRLKINTEMVNLTITDDGKGFALLEESETNNLGLGLSNMRSLVNSRNGIIKINSIIGEGTEIKIVIPLKQKLMNQHGGLAI